MSSAVHAFEQEVMFLSQSLLQNLIRALKAARLFLVVQVRGAGVPRNTLEQSSKVQSKLRFKLPFYGPLLMTHASGWDIKSTRRSCFAYKVVRSEREHGSRSITKDFDKYVFKKNVLLHYPNTLASQGCRESFNEIFQPRHACWWAQSENAVGFEWQINEPLFYSHICTKWKVLSGS